MTLYRLGSESPVIDALLAAAKNKKDVTAVVELKASFDEETNFRWATNSKRAASTLLWDTRVSKSMKMLSGDQNRERANRQVYANISTGNYNAKTRKDLLGYLDIHGYEDICIDAERHCFQCFQALFLPPRIDV